VTEEIIIYDIAKQYTPYPAGRFKKNGNGSGEGFREVLVQMLNNSANKIKLIMDNTYGYGSSFLEEAFGGLVRVNNLSPQEIRQRIDFDTKDKGLIIEINQYMADAQKEKEKR
jgi:hypothetical protein